MDIKQTEADKRTGYIIIGNLKYRDKYQEHIPAVIFLIQLKNIKIVFKKYMTQR